MATTTQYNPNHALNARLLAAGASKTVYAMVTPQLEAAKAAVFGDAGSVEREDYLNQFRDAWTGKQDTLHEDFFNVWHKWSSPVIDLDRSLFPFYYPTAGASEPIRHLIYELASKNIDGAGRGIAAFDGEYEGYRAMAEAAGLWFFSFNRLDWDVIDIEETDESLFFISAPSAIDGNVWEHFNAFLERMPPNSVVVDVTYVGAIGEGFERFNLNHPSVKAVVFSLSKPFGAYYDRIGGVFLREENAGLFGNKWFKGLTGLNLGIRLMEDNDVFAMSRRYSSLQAAKTTEVSEALGIDLKPSDVFILAHGDEPEVQTDLGEYLNRAGTVRVCLTPGMTGEINS